MKKWCHWQSKHVDFLSAPFLTRPKRDFQAGDLVKIFTAAK